MLKRTKVMAAAMLGLGTLLGYAAAWGGRRRPAPMSDAELVMKDEAGKSMKMRRLR